VMQEVGYSGGLARVHNNLGMVYAQQGKYTLAKDTFRQAIALWSQLDLPLEQANTEGNLAEAYLAQNMWESALQILMQARERLSVLEPTPRIQAMLGEIQELTERGLAGLAQLEL